MRKILLLLTLCSGGFLNAQSWSWSQGSYSSTFCKANDCATDKAGNTYLCGTFNDSVQFSWVSLTDTGTACCFIAKYNANGMCMWAKKFPMMQEGVAIDIDSAAHVYLLSRFSATYMLSKWDSSGNLLWADPLPNGFVAKDVRVDISEYGILVAGVISAGSVDFYATDTIQGPIAIVAFFSSASPYYSYRPIGRTGNISPNFIDQDANGDVYVAAQLSGPDTIGMQPFSTAGSSLLVLKLDNAFNLLWYQCSDAPAPGNAYASPFGICVDTSLNTYVTAGFVTQDFVLGTDTIHMNASGQTPALIKLDAAGNIAWIDQPTFTGTGQVAFMPIVCGKNGVYFSGYTYEDFTLGSVSVTNTTNAYTTGFVIGVDFAGNSMYSVQTSGNSSHMVPGGISIDTTDAVYVVGYRDHGVNFGSYYLPVTPGGDAFTAKVVGGPVGINEQSSPDSFSLLPTCSPKTFVLQTNNCTLYNNSDFILYDMSGRMIKSIRVDGHSTAIDCSDLATGFYTWTVENSGGRFAAGKLLNQ